MRTTNPSIRRSRISRKTQRGVTLFFGMLFLLTIVLLTLGGVAMSRYQQRLALAMKDREVAFQKASQAQRAAELSLYFLLADDSGNDKNRTSSETLDIAGWDLCESTFPSFPSNNRCRYQLPPKDNPYADIGLNWKDVPQAPLQNLSTTPDTNTLRNYLIEAIPEEGTLDNFGNPSSYVFRITAVGQGKFAQKIITITTSNPVYSQVRLQETYRIDQIDNSGQ